MANRFGYEIRRKEWDGWSIESLRGLCQPCTVVDVGVGYGTPELYDAFPEAFLILVEPLTEFERDIGLVLNEHDGVHLRVALGESVGESMIDVTRRPTQSSLHSRTELTRKEIVNRRTIPVSTLDAVIEQHTPPRPYLIKIDTEGHELAVVAGGSRAIAGAECVIAEVSIATRFNDSYSFLDFMTAMDRLDFELIDILSLSRGPGKRARRMDAAFLPKGSREVSPRIGVPAR